MLRVTTIVLAAMALMAAPAGAKTFTAQRGGVQATVTYSGTATTRLTIVRNGATLFDGVPSLADCGGQPCAPSGFSGDPPLRVVDLDRNGEPEVIYSAYTGGAHCCTVAQVYRLNPAGTGYATDEHNFGDPGFTLRDLAGDGGREFVTRDDVFAYAFTAYAFSGLPVQVLRWSAGAYTNVTRSFPALIRKDAKLWRSAYMHARKRTDRTQQGAAAAWAADEYNLGRRTAALSFLHREVRRGHLHAGFVKTLRHFLSHHGY